jgi:DNA-binding transcriptional MerR regulator
MSDETELEPQTEACYSLDSVENLTGVSRQEILIYCRSGLVSPFGSVESEDLTFNDEGVYRIRRIEYLRAQQGINLAGIRMIFELTNEVRRLENEIRFHR